MKYFLYVMFSLETIVLIDIVLTECVLWPFFPKLVARYEFWLETREFAKRKNDWMKKIFDDAK